MPNFNSIELTNILRATQSLLYVLMAVVAYQIWKKQQKKIRESQAAQAAIQAQIALRLKIDTCCQNLLNQLLVYEVSDKEIIINLINMHRSAFEEKYIDLIQKLYVCKMLWGKAIDDIIESYETAYNDLQAVLNALYVSKINSRSIEEEKTTMVSLVSRMAALESGYSLLSDHLI